MRPPAAIARTAFHNFAMTRTLQTSSRFQWQPSINRIALCSAWQWHQNPADKWL